MNTNELEPGLFFSTLTDNAAKLLAARKELAQLEEHIPHRELPAPPVIDSPETLARWRAGDDEAHEIYRVWNNCFCTLTTAIKHLEYDIEKLLDFLEGTWFKVYIAAGLAYGVRSKSDDGNTVIEILPWSEVRTD